MPRGKKGKGLGSKSRATRKSATRVTQAARKKALDNSATASTPHHNTRSGLRTRASAGSAVSITDDPESILRKARKARRSEKAKGTAQAQDRPESPFRPDLQSVVKSIETPLAEEDSPQEYSDEELRIQSQDPDSEDNDPQRIFNRKWGYLPPLDEEAVAIIDAIIANPAMGREFKRIGADNANFLQGLRYRNVFLTESPAPDPHANHVKTLAPETSISETDGEKESHGQLWILDQAKCNQGSNEALFQRTFMMSLIARHSFIYARDATTQTYLDFSVEEPWSCPAMPTRAYEKNASYLSQPRPDLAVCFRRQAVILDYLWNKMPIATKQLACFENLGDIAETRVFHFFTIEAKKALKSADDSTGKRQGLNNASQALHNMFEFFRDAGQEHESIFFEKVRFFSVVASTEGLTIRIHRATREPEDRPDQGFIIPEYPLRFEYQELFRFQKDNLDRKTVLETFEKILIGYGANELRHLLHDAAIALMVKLENNLEAMRARENDEYYRYGQTSIPLGSTKEMLAAKTLKPNLAVSQNHSLQNSRAVSETNTSLGVARSEELTPTLSRPSTSMPPAFSEPRKRRREQSVNSESAKKTRQKKTQ